MKIPTAVRVMAALLLALPVAALAADGVSGEYLVPVPEELREFANFSVEPTLDNDRSPRSIRFALPAELIGEATTIELRRQRDGSFSGPKADARCTRDEFDFSCETRFKNLDIDLDKAATAIATKFDDPREIDGRIQVARIFSTEPLGILSYRLPKYRKQK